MSPFADYLSLATYENAGSAIQPAGFFAVGMRYVHPPVVDFTPKPRASRYEVYLIQEDRIHLAATAVTPPIVAKNGWDQMRPGKAGVVIAAFDGQDKRIALSRLFPFYVAPGFNEKTRRTRSKTLPPGRHRRVQRPIRFQAAGRHLRTQGRPRLEDPACPAGLRGLT